LLTTLTAGVHGRVTEPFAESLPSTDPRRTAKTENTGHEIKHAETPPRKAGSIRWLSDAEGSDDAAETTTIRSCESVDE
jgi:hypothetical protein